MPSPKFYPFSGDRFDARGVHQDTANGGGHGDDDDAMPTDGIRPVARRHFPVAHSDIRPTTELQALMEAPPNSEPEQSIEASTDLREHIEGLLHRLEPRERFVIDMLYYGVPMDDANGGEEGGLSLRDIGRMMNLSKDTVANLRNSALQKMRNGTC